MSSGPAPLPENRPCLQRPAGSARRRTAETWQRRQPWPSALLHCRDGAARPMGLTQNREEFEKVLAPAG
jgi:hypothetical protein